MLQYQSNIQIATTLFCGMPLDKNILKHAIIQLIAVQYRTTWDEVLNEFEIDNKMAFYVILDKEDELKNTIPRFCKLCNLSVLEFKEYYKELVGLVDPLKA